MSKRILLIITFILVVFFSCKNSPIEPEDPPTPELQIPQIVGISWDSLKSLPFPSMSGEAVVCDGNIHVVGGRRRPYENGNYHYMYNPDSNEWEIKANLSTGRSNLAIANVNNKIYVFGGDEFLNSVEIYGPSNDTWTDGAPMPTARQHIDCGVVDGKVYVIGGLTSWSEVSDKNEMYDPASNTWEEKTPVPTPRNNPAVEVVDGKIYVIGGGGNEESIWTPLATVEVYDPATDTWETSSSLPNPRFKPSTAVVYKNIFVIGGFIDENVVPRVNVYDPVTDEWKTVDRFPKDVVFAGVTSIDNKIFVMGGCAEDFAAYSSNIVGTVETNGD